MHPAGKAVIDDWPDTTDAERQDIAVTNALNHLLWYPHRKREELTQFVGHSKLFEGKRPSFFTDLRYLLIGPAWILAKAYRRLGLTW